MDKNTALEHAISGLDFFVRTQVTSAHSADFGRLPNIYNCHEQKVVAYSTNWTTGVICEALMVGHAFTGNEKYLETVRNAVYYMKSLQDFNPLTPRVNGVFHEVTPQSPMAHPRDALTAAWALLDYSTVDDNRECFERARLYADWFCEVGMEKGYPYWTVRFDDQDWEPINWCGSFHSGSAFFMYRMFCETGDDKYRQAMEDILQFYNKHHLNPDGSVNIILERDTLECQDGKCEKAYTIYGWEIMHKYNDDFGALANLAAWKKTGNTDYRDAAQRFLDKMVKSQQSCGGFGPDDWKDPVPSAGGAVIQEMLAAEKLGVGKPEYLAAVDRAVDYLSSIQVKDKYRSDNGAFFGMTDNYEVTGETANLRTAAYAIIGLLRYAGAVDKFYYFN